MVGKTAKADKATYHHGSAISQLLIVQWKIEIETGGMMGCVAGAVTKSRGRVSKGFELLETVCGIP